MTKLSVWVDPRKCDAQGVCYQVSPTVFSPDRYGYAVVGPEASVADDETWNSEARSASELCPRAAIVLREKRDGTQLRGNTHTPADILPATATSGGQTNRLLVEEGVESYSAWSARGGFGELNDSLVEHVARTNLRGAGGSHFPVARKWASLPRSGRATLICNAAEREPGTLKDTEILRRRPFLVLDGLRVVAQVISASEAIIATVDGDSELVAAVKSAVDVWRVESPEDCIPVSIATLPAEYLAGEESALIAGLEGRTLLPKPRPPYPSERGYRGRPTLVHNVETLANVALLNAHGAPWMEEVGTGDEPGTGLFTVGRYGGDFTVFERPFGYPLKDLLRDARLDGDVRVVLVGGLSGSYISDIDKVLLSSRSLAEHNASLGTKSVQVLTKSDCILQTTAEILDFFAHSTAQQCPPCYRGLPEMRDTLLGIIAGESASLGDLDEMMVFATTLPGRGVCALPDRPARLFQSVFTEFQAEVRYHLEQGCCAP